MQQRPSQYDVRLIWNFIHTTDNRVQGPLSTSQRQVLLGRTAAASQRAQVWLGHPQIDPALRRELHQALVQLNHLKRRLAGQANFETHPLSSGDEFTASGMATSDKVGRGALPHGSPRQRSARTRQPAQSAANTRTALNTATGSNAMRRQRIVALQRQIAKLQGELTPARSAVRHAFISALTQSYHQLGSQSAAALAAEDGEPPEEKSRKALAVIHQTASTLAARTASAIESRIMAVRRALSPAEIASIARTIMSNGAYRDKTIKLIVDNARNFAPFLLAAAAPQYALKIAVVMTIAKLLADLKVLTNEFPKDSNKEFALHEAFGTGGYGTASGSAGEAEDEALSALEMAAL